MTESKSQLQTVLDAVHKLVKKIAKQLTLKHLK